MKKYSQDLLLPQVTDEINFQYGNFNARVYFWQQLYKKYPDNYWCKVFGNKMRNATDEERQKMLDKSFVLEDMFYNAVVNKISTDSQEALDLMWEFIDHLEFFHEFNEFFYDVFMEFCERGSDLNERMPDIQLAIEKNPKFLKDNPLFGLVSKEYVDIIYNMLKINKDIILKAK